MHLPEFDNRFTRELPGDPVTGTQRRQVHNACYSLVDPSKVSAPSLISYSSEVADLFDWQDSDCESQKFLNAMSGNELLEGMQSYSMCYGGHQFGNWAGQLGDGRAINLGEALNSKGEHWVLQLKGAGETPYSRTADGLAVLRSSVREYLCSEAMYHLGVPTTRALSLVTTGEQVMRDMLYDGRPEYEPGAIVCRVAPSFIRFGNFQIFASRKEYAELKQLTDFTIRHHFPELNDEHTPASKSSYSAFFQRVCELTATMIVDWMRVGFVHGVMNTDNMSILGLTIDYGPYGWLDNYDPEWTPNTTDAGQKRYRYSQQPNIALWNLYQLANALYPLIEDAKPLEEALAHFQSQYQQQSQAMMAAKLGLSKFQDSDQTLFSDLESVLTAVETDMTIFYRALASEQLSYESLKSAWYEPESHNDEFKQSVKVWLERYSKRLEQEPRPAAERCNAMNLVNPKYIFRNYLAQQAIDKATAGDHSMINELLELYRRPYEEQAEFGHYAEKRPDWAKSKVGCSMLSCSS